MRGFLILSFVAVAASARLGYDYRPNGGLGGSGLGIGSSSGSSGLGGGLNTGLGGGLGGGLAYSGVNGGGLNGGLISSAGLGGGYAPSIGSGSHSSGVVSGPVVTEYNKEFYFHSAPEEEIHSGGASQRITNTLKKNLRVVFIKAPENNGLTNAALQIARQATEDRTAIYVLTKQNDVSELSHQLQQIQEVRSQKPEVRFIKYRTPEDALNAQRAIQAQYDALGGTSKSSNEGIAPVLNYASSSPVGHHQSSLSQLSPSGSISSGSILSSPSASYISPKSSYLPPVAI